MNVTNVEIRLFRHPNPTKNDKYLLRIDLDVGGSNFTRLEHYGTQREAYINAYATLAWFDYNHMPYLYFDKIKETKR